VLKPGLSAAQRLVRVVAGIAVAALLVRVASASDAVSAPPTPPPKLVAQFGLGDVLGASKDLAVKAALSEFGKSLGDQLPIVVDAADAYPTTPHLPGAPFAATSAPDIGAALRASRDGTVMLAPGDYQFTVGVFCMQAHAGSPSGHRYLVAPLHGSAADIITALNSRIPSYSVDHHALQVLSWDIQAGMAYDVMQPDQRKAVDRIIPEYRSRLGGDAYERIHDEYMQTAQRVPGMPSFEDALSRLGPAGAQVVALQNLRQELAQPLPTYAQIAQALVPILPVQAARVVDARGETPWSRYSDRVYVRFVTAGNYATPGTYEVRVLAPSGPAAWSGARPARLGFARRVTAATDDARLGAGSRRTRAPARVAATIAAAVPFTNIVNNPGTATVQPLTLTPELGAPPPDDKVALTSSTVAPQPADHRRTTIGVGEEVELTFTPGVPDWSITTARDGVLKPAGEHARYTAASQAGQETIVARGAHGTATLTFNVIEPDGVFGLLAPCTHMYHVQNTPDTGMVSYFYVLPDTVSFKYIDVREVNSLAHATGVYAEINGTGHMSTNDPNQRGVAIQVSEKVVPGRGSLANGDDLAIVALDMPLGLNFPPLAPPLVPGTVVWLIPMEYRVRVPINVTGRQWRPFAGGFREAQVHTLDGTGKLTTTKNGAEIHGMVGDKTKPNSDEDHKQQAERDACPQKP
jgi:hypothetical protein